MKIKKKERKFSIEWQDGAVLHFDVPCVHEIILEYPDRDDSYRLNMLILKSISGWTGIEDEESGKAIPFSPAMAKQIFDFILQDAEMLQKITTAIGGPLGNSIAGSISTSITDGTGENADDARKIPIPGPAK